MNTLKKLFSLCLAVMLVLSLAVPAMAETDPTYTITLLEPADNHTYEAYQIFSGEYSDGVLSTVQWGKNFNAEKASDFISALKSNQYIGSVFSTLSTNSTAGDVASMLAAQNLNNDAEITQHFADVLYTNTKNADGTISYTYLLSDNGDHAVVTATKEGKNDQDRFQYTFIVPAGYYLIKDKDGSQDNKHDFYTRLLLQVAGNATIAPKGSVPSVKKHVNYQIGGTYTQATDMSMLGEVYFKLEGTLPDNYDKYETYTYTFVDTLPKGLDFDNENDFSHSMNTDDTTDDIIGMGGVVECFIQHNNGMTSYVNIGGDSGLTLDATDKTGQADKGDLYYSYVVNDNSTKTLTIKFYDLKTTFPNLVDDDVIVVKYAAKVNKSALIGKGNVDGHPANENTVVLQFSNNPQGDDMGQTIPDTAEVYTYQLEIDKVDDANRSVSLDGAIFLIGNKFAQTSRAAEDPVDDGPAVDNIYDYMYPVFDVDTTNNTYTLAGGVTTDVPIRDYSIETTDGVTKYIALDQNGHTITAINQSEPLDLSNIMMVSNQDDNKHIKIIGLDAGSYLLRELKAPAGFNKITDSITVVITTEHNAQNGELTTFKVHALGEDVQGEVATGNLKLTLTNTKGSVLPSTGGIGTTIFYIAGGIMAVAAIVLLITKKRMSDY